MTKPQFKGEQARKRQLLAKFEGRRSLMKAYYAAMGSKGGKETARRWWRVPIPACAGWQLVHRTTGEIRMIATPPSFLQKKGLHDAR